MQDRVWRSMRMRQRTNRSRWRWIGGVQEEHHIFPTVVH